MSSSQRDQSEPQTGTTRREMLRAFGGGLGSLGMITALGPQVFGETTPSQFPGKARRVIHLFMNGGPFQGDLFDPKPHLLKFAGQRPAEADLRTERRTAGLLPSPFRFRPAGKCGLPVSELLPLTSKCIDDMCIIRSMYTDNPNHGPALLLMNNGTILPTRPSMGSWMSYGLGSENTDLPAYVVLCPGKPVRRSRAHV